MVRNEKGWRFASRGSDEKTESNRNIASVDTILRWYRELIARKWTFKRKSAGRRRTKKEIRELILQMARENEGGIHRNCGSLEEPQVQIESKHCGEYIAKEVTKEETTN